MTIAISIKINDGVVLASDSASTVLGKTPEGTPTAINVYNNANKVFNLRKGLPVGAITWGSGSIGQASTSTVVKDLRQILTDGDANHDGWRLNPNTFTVEGVATRFREFVFEEMYATAFRDSDFKPDLGFIVAGYSAGAPMAEEFQIESRNGECIGPTRLRARDDVGMTWGGDPEALNRLILGVSRNVGPFMENVLRIPAPKVLPVLNRMRETLQIPLIVPSMPLQDAIDLAEFCVDLTIKFSRFTPGAPTVGGPIDLAAITKHEGFRWVRRKYYFDRALNPEERFTRVREPKQEGSAEVDNAE